MGPRRVLAITAIRSEYFLQRPIFQAIAASPNLELELVVAGVHLSPLHGLTVNTIEQDGFRIVERIENFIYGDTDSSRLKGAAFQLQTLAHVVSSRRPDWLLAPADREEALNMALCGAYMNIPTAHYSAGDRVVGNVDDTVRHAISRLSHLLLTTNEDARERLIRSGEEEWRAHNVGHAGLDRIRQAPAMNDAVLAHSLGVREIAHPYLVVIQHPVSSEIAQAANDMEQTLASIVGLGVQAFVSYPNSDPGSHGIIDKLAEYSQHPNIHVFRNIPDTEFVNLLRGAAALVGNSSAGLLEAPFLGLPAVNVGTRQSKRHHADNVFFVPSEKKLITERIQQMLNDASTKKRTHAPSHLFGDGHTGAHVATLLADIPIDTRLLNKVLTY